MSVVVIGDRAVGKSHMALALAELALLGNAEQKRVIIIDPSYEILKDELTNLDTGMMVPTRQITERPIRIEVQLDRTRIIDSVWIDTPGEIWDDEWQKDHSNAWNEFKQNIGKNLAIILLLPPYQERVLPELINRASPDMTLEREKLMNAERWRRNLEDWLKFLNQNCSRVNNIAICLHKADLFCENLDAEAKEMVCHPVDRQSRVRNRFFSVAQDVIDRHNREERPFQFFVTSVSHPILLTAPWLYLSPLILYHR
jgi:hypothetical protein